MSAPCRVAVVGHVEWAEFAVVERYPQPGDIVHAESWWQQAAGGGAVAAVQLAKLAGHASFLTALADDDMGEASHTELTAAGVSIHAGRRPPPQRRVFVHLDPAGERTISVLGGRMIPRRADPIDWEQLGDFDAVYFTGGDVDALRAARAARVLVATPRAADVLLAAGVEVDVLVNSGKDPGEALPPETLRPAPRHVVSTLGARGGRWIGREGLTGTWAAAPLPGPAVDAYGCGDSFAAGLTYALGRGDSLDAAVALAARCGAACLTGRGPYTGQLRLAR